jgi:hypothetical protein
VVTRMVRDLDLAVAAHLQGGGRAGHEQVGRVVEWEVGGSGGLEGLSGMGDSRWRPRA